MRKELTVVTFIIFLLIGCSKTSDKEYLEMASENVKNGNISEAIVAYESLVEEYPQSNLAPEALVSEATLYHSNKVKNISKEEALKKAAKIFYSVAAKYPSSNQAPKSLFMAGFIYANELQDFGEATKVYNMFIEKYPQHELSASAKEELENMGLSPDEILKKKTASREK